MSSLKKHVTLTHLTDTHTYAHTPKKYKLMKKKIKNYVLNLKKVYLFGFECNRVKNDSKDMHCLFDGWPTQGATRRPDSDQLGA